MERKNETEGEGEGEENKEHKVGAAKEANTDQKPMIKMKLPLIYSTNPLRGTL